MLEQVKLWKYTPEKIREYRNTATYRMLVNNIGHEMSDGEVIQRLKGLNEMFGNSYVITKQEEY